MKPLVSLCLMCCNQERYIADALRGAFAQTYRPLEIVVSDDASTDRSWEIVESAVAEYRRRPDAVGVVVSRNARNLGITGNWSRLCSLAKGELLVKADGDDVSLPDRVERIVSAWEADGRRATLVSSGGWMIGPRGERLGPMPQASSRHATGAAMAFSRVVADAYGEPANPRIIDDETYVRRALMLGPELVVPDRLILYRLGTGCSNSFWRVRAPLVRARGDLLAALEQSRRDLECVRGRIGADAARGWERRLEGESERCRAELELFTSPAFGVRLAALRRLPPVRALSVWGFLRFAFLMPRPVGAALLAPYVLLRHAVRRLRGIADPPIPHFCYNIG
ncbi:MAG: glycosyltransferase [Kiritimatiellae bacterium]|nr:glycosyltransferase [Kiritimatiellia bacterium]